MLRCLAVWLSICVVKLLLYFLQRRLHQDWIWFLATQMFLRDILVRFSFNLLINFVYIISCFERLLYYKTPHHYFKICENCKNMSFLEQMFLTAAFMNTLYPSDHRTSNFYYIGSKAFRFLHQCYTQVFCLPTDTLSACNTVPAHLEIYKTRFMQADITKAPNHHCGQLLPADHRYADRSQHIAS